VPLQNTNLIEASAGTGKTYYIAILVLRLIVEKGLSIKEILMVTFTKAAVAELEERVRLFVKQGYKASLHEPIKDAAIAGIVQQAAAGSSATEVQRRLREAVLFLDETAVLTIHGFCQQTLTEFAFETGQLFGAETMQDTNAVLQEEVNKFWRRHITTLPAELLSFLVAHHLSREAMMSVVKEHLGGKMYAEYEAGKTYGYCEDDQLNLVKELHAIKAVELELRQKMMEYIAANADRLRANAATNTYARKAGLHEFEDAETFVDVIIDKADKGYIKTLFADILTHCDDCKEAEDEVTDRVRQVLHDVYCQAINAVQQGMQEYKQRNNLLSFDDMIVHLHEALTSRQNEALVAELQNKFKVVFVDEFQDTDRLQYEIFEKAFGEQTVVFLIGDPKQSIYAWRKADIFTYFKAKENVAHLYTMNNNFRSGERLIEAMNIFFEPQPGFDTFHFGASEQRINYHPVQSPPVNKKGALFFADTAVVPLTISRANNNEVVMETVAAQVIDLLNNPAFTIQQDGQTRAINPSDIGILVRTKKQGKKVKRVLARYCIPAITIDDTRVLNSDEAAYVLYLLEAMLDNTSRAIKKALLSPFTGFCPGDILHLSEAIILDRFKLYHDIWQQDGVYTALLRFVHDFNVHFVLLDTNTENGERIIANLYQLIELVHKVQSNKQFSPAELTGWLRRGIEGMETEGDEYEQRVESDEDSVKIVTIHKSKGLEYNIVFAPFLDLVENTKIEMYSFRHPDTGQYMTVEKNRCREQQKAWIDEQNEQENRRLVYVAITRAVYKCYLTHNTYHKSSTLATFLKVLPVDGVLIEEVDPPEVDLSFRYQPATSNQIDAPPRAVAFSLLQNNWTKMSYTMLAKKGDITGKPKSRPQGDTYEQFMFGQLPRGSKSGNLLHYLFENAAFNNPTGWPYVIDEALKRYLPANATLFAPLLLQVLQQVYSVPITVEGSTFLLSEVTPDHCLHEFEFDFPVPEFNPALLNQLHLASLPVQVAWHKPLQGIVNGKMDLFFEHGGKYFILDWKSNYLGDTLADYAPEALNRAMTDNNYHLQYLLYTLAATKYLHSRLPAFDYETQFGSVIYLFVRGVRQNSATGIFACSPTLEQLEKLEGVLNG
jgi:exodeoxyribonuclease V beta subunit